MTGISAAVLPTKPSAMARERRRYQSIYQKTSESNPTWHAEPPFKEGHDPVIAVGHNTKA